MQTTITARHCEISDALKARTMTIVERLGNIASRPVESAVVFDIDGDSQTAELRLHLASGELLIATGEAGDHLSALDRAEAKLRRQLEKVVPRARRTRTPPASSV